MSGYRLPAGGLIDRKAPVRLLWDGEGYTGFSGDNLASALVANGVSLFGRSFKYHRPRGLLGMGAEEPNALVTIDRGPGRVTPNLRAPALPVYEGMAATSQNRYPSLKYDLGEVNNSLSTFLPAGFYNKTFMWPRAAWEKLYEPAIRRMAGLGESPKASDPDHYEAVYAHCEVLVIGAGPAGIEAAITAAKADPAARVVLIDEQEEIGGGALSDPDLWDWLKAAYDDISALPNLQVLPRTTGIAYLHDNYVAAAERLTDHLPISEATGPRERLWRFRAGEVILAQGAIERPLVFDGNDTPGVMLASAGRTLALRYGVAPGRAVAVVATHDSGWTDAIAIAKAGVNVTTIIDARATVSADLLAAARAQGITVMTAHSVIGVKGRLEVTAVETASTAGSISSTIPADCLLMAGGWTPTLHLWSHSKGTMPGARTCPTSRSRTPASSAPGQGTGPSAAARPSPRSPPRAPRTSSKPSSISRTTSPPRTSASPCARASARSSTSSAIPPTAWPPIRAKPATSTACRSLRRACRSPSQPSA